MSHSQQRHRQQTTLSLHRAFPHLRSRRLSHLIFQWMMSAAGARSWIHQSYRKCLLVLILALG